MRTYTLQAMWVILLAPVLVSANQSSTFDLSTLSQQGRTAYNILLRAHLFSIGPVGYAGQSSESEEALHTLLAEKEAISACQDILSRGTAEGKMYALYGLYVKDRKIFKEVAEQFKDGQKAQGKINTLEGCIVMAEDARSIITNIESGYYGALFKASGKRD